jgi:hypothetical protein
MRALAPFAQKKRKALTEKDTFTQQAVSPIASVRLASPPGTGLAYR